MRADIIVSGCAVLTMGRAGIIERGIIAIRDGKILYVGGESEAPSFESDEIIDGRGKIAMPGLINCHTHIAMTLFRGVAEDKELSTWLRETIWPLESKLKPSDVYYGALLGFVEMIKSGTTCLLDMYFYEDIVARAAEESGMRCVLAPGIFDAGHKMLGSILLRRALKFVKKYHGKGSGRIHAMLGPHAVYTCSPDLLRMIGEEAARLNIGVHIHLAESESESINIRRIYGKSEVELLDEVGLLRPNLVAAHCIHLSNHDVSLMAKKGVKVVYNPISNMKLSSGIPRVKDLLDAGLTVGLGTDGPASNNCLDMFETMKVAALLQKALYRDPRVLPAKKVVEMATIDGARVLGLDHFIGSIEVGKRADIILIDVNKPHLTPLHDIYAALVYSARGSDVDTVIIDGKVVMRGRLIETVDEHEVMRKATETSQSLLSRKSLRGSLIKRLLRRNKDIGD
ncbi:MAG: amidohydrolase [Candidatus Bathyarchaeia archaeon]|nr:amidohydrolase [Candidatus Bathyarchaeota archaeon]